jgi:hypothetical protein
MIMSFRIRELPEAAHGEKMGPEPFPGKRAMKDLQPIVAGFSA